MGKLHFLPIKTPQSGAKTKKAQELDDLEARSHAAQVSHARAGRGALAKGKENLSLISTMSTKLSTSRNQYTNPVRNMASDPLDLFFILPVTLNSNERTLLHSCK
jgi:hypothetical protein